MTKRPPIPERVKRAAIVLNMQRNGGKLLCAETGAEITLVGVLHSFLQFDHNPPLELRYRFPDGTYRPDANDVGHIDVCSVEGHSIRTNKRRGLSPGDQTEIARSRKVRAQTAEIAAMNERKAGRAPNTHCATPEGMEAHKRGETPAELNARRIRARVPQRLKPVKLSKARWRILEEAASTYNGALSSFTRSIGICRPGNFRQMVEGLVRDGYMKKVGRDTAIITDAGLALLSRRAA